MAALRSTHGPYHSAFGPYFSLFCFNINHYTKSLLAIHPTFEHTKKIYPFEKQILNAKQCLWESDSIKLSANYDLLANWSSLSFPLSCTSASLLIAKSGCSTHSALPNALPFWVGSDKLWRFTGKALGGLIFAFVPI